MKTIPVSSRVLQLTLYFFLEFKLGIYKQKDRPLVVLQKDKLLVRQKSFSPDNQPFRLLHFKISSRRKREIKVTNW